MTNVCESSLRCFGRSAVQTKDSFEFDVHQASPSLNAVRRSPTDINYDDATR